MLVFMVGSSGGSALLSGDHARFVAVPQRGQKTPREAGLSLKKGGPPDVRSALGHEALQASCGHMRAAVELPA
jgi:hypothetical protein